MGRPPVLRPQLRRDSLGGPRRGLRCITSVGGPRIDALAAFCASPGRSMDLHVVASMASSSPITVAGSTLSISAGLRCGAISSNKRPPNQRLQQTGAAK